MDTEENNGLQNTGNVKAAHSQTATVPTGCKDRRGSVFPCFLASLLPTWRVPSTLCPNIPCPFHPFLRHFYSRNRQNSLVSPFSFSLLSFSLFFLSEFQWVEYDRLWSDLPIFLECSCLPLGNFLYLIAQLFSVLKCATAYLISKISTYFKITIVVFFLGYSLFHFSPWQQYVYTIFIFGIFLTTCCIFL